MAICAECFVRGNSLGSVNVSLAEIDITNFFFFFLLVFDDVSEGHFGHNIKNTLINT